MTGTILAIILAVFKAIPKIKELWDELVTMYIDHEIANMHEKDKEAIRKAIDGKDQRDLETQIGNPNPGSPSGLPHTVIRDELPGVPNPKKS